MYTVVCYSILPLKEAVKLITRLLSVAFCRLPFAFIVSFVVDASSSSSLSKRSCTFHLVRQSRIQYSTYDWVEHRLWDGLKNHDAKCPMTSHALHLLRASCHIMYYLRTSNLVRNIILFATPPATIACLPCGSLLSVVLLTSISIILTGQ